LEEEIDATADDASALTDTQREKQEQALLDQILIAEREECALIEMAAADGTMIAYRPDTSPLAVLGLASRRRLSEHQKWHTRSQRLYASHSLPPYAELARDAAAGSIPASPPRGGVTAQGVSRVIRLFGPKGTPTPLG
jgi:hypothetical protein